MHLAIAGLISNVAPYYLFAVGESLTSSAYAGIPIGTTPLWTAAIVLLLSRHAPPRLQIAGLVVGFLGTILIFEPWRHTAAGSIAGVAACLPAAALYGLSYVYMARYVTPQPFNTIALAAGQLGTAALLSIALLPLDRGAIHPPTLTAVIAVLILGIAGTGLAYVLNYALLTAEGPTATSLVAYLIPSSQQSSESSSSATHSHPSLDSARSSFSAESPSSADDPTPNKRHDQERDDRKPGDYGRTPASHIR